MPATVIHDCEPDDLEEGVAAVISGEVLGVVLATGKLWWVQVGRRISYCPTCGEVLAETQQEHEARGKRWP